MASDKLKQKQKRYRAYYGWSSIKTISGTKREIIQRLGHLTATKTRMDIQDTLEIHEIDDKRLSVKCVFGIGSSRNVDDGTFTETEQKEMLYGANYVQAIDLASAFIQAFGK